MGTYRFTVSDVSSDTLNINSPGRADPKGIADTVSMVVN